MRNKTGQTVSWMTNSLVLSVLTIAVSSRLLLTFANWFTLSVLPMVPNMNPGLPDSFLPNHKWLDGWVRWDSIHYVLIATEGYGRPTSTSPGTGVGFFPAFPMAMRFGAWLMGDTTNQQYAAIAGVITANLCFMIAAIMLALLVRRHHSKEIALTAVVLFSFSPVSFFFSAAYTESMFVMGVIGAFLLAERGNWWGSALMAALASGTRLFGLFLIPALLLAAWQKREPIRSYIPLIVISPLGTVAYFGWLWWRNGTPFGYFESQANWGDWNIRVGNYIRTLLSDPSSLITDPLRGIILIYVAIAIVFALSLPLAYKTTSRPIFAFSALMVAFHMVYTWNSLGRYMLPAIGCFIGVAWLLHQPKCPRWINDLLIAGSALLMVTLSILYAHGHWII